jgi:tRNA(Arg) A34 adenosine deaminase TadA
MQEKLFDPDELLPAWLREFMAEKRDTSFSGNERLKLVIELSRLNILHETGGPFAAAVFDHATGRLVSVGVNLVVRSNCSHAHAEMVALALAEHRLSTFTLFSPGKPGYELSTSCEPCAMCFGAIIWSGVSRLVCGATSTDANNAGFDEGPKPENWVQELEQRGIEVNTGIFRNEAAAILLSYNEKGGIIYNAR